MCQVHSRPFQEGWLPLSFLRGEKLVVIDLGDNQQFQFWGLRATLWNLPSQPPGWPLGSLSTCSPADPPSGRLPSFLITWEVHCRSGLSSTLPYNLGENNQGRKWLKPGDALKGKCPSPTLFPYPPSIIGIVPGSAHQSFSHCYSVHPRLSTHHPRLYLYHSSIPALWDSLARI